MSDERWTLEEIDDALDDPASSRDEHDWRDWESLLLTARDGLTARVETLEGDRLRLQLLDDYGKLGAEMVEQREELEGFVRRLLESAPAAGESTKSGEHVVVTYTVLEWDEMVAACNAARAALATEGGRLMCELEEGECKIPEYEMCVCGKPWPCKTLGGSDGKE